MTVYGKWKGGGEARREESGSVNATWLRNSSVPGSLNNPPLDVSSFFSET